MKKGIRSALLLACAAVIPLVSGAALAGDTPARISIREPVKHNNKGGFIEGRDWNMEIRISVENPLGFVELLGSGDAREALVISDADNCLDFDLGHTSFSLSGPFGGSCSDLVVDEVFIPFRSDPNDRAGVSDIDFCQTPSELRLQDDPASTPPEFSNKAYLRGRDQFISGGTLSSRPVGPLTGGETIDDCYGYGRDEDLPGLVIMADIGAARVFDENFDLVYVQPDVRRIRNLAGFVTSVTRELRDRNNRSHIVAHVQMERGVLEPIVVFDTRIGPTTPPFIGPTFQRRVESGPVETFTWDTQPSTDYSLDEFEQLYATLDSVTSVKVRAVLVEGDAPEFIDDLDKNGVFNAKDLQLMGYTLLTNQAGRTFNVIQADSVEDFGGALECPPTGVVFGADFDNNGAGYICQDGDGNSRSIKRLPD